MDPTVDGAPVERYVVSEYLAEGGMGAIYLGKKLGAGGFAKEVVLKQLLPEFTRQPEFIDLFLREARLSATLDHANIIHTIDLVTAGDEYFIVMEYLAGADLRTLAKRIKRRRRKLAPAAALYIAREVLSALAYAHAKTGPDGAPLRLIHRDVSPSNVLVSRHGEVKLTDFGIAKAATHTSVFYKVKGKVGYMSPEQARSEELDHRSDLYSLAVCLHELITGERLFVVAGLTTSAEQIYSQPVPRLSDVVPGLPADLDKIMARALAIDPDERYQSAGAMQEALLRCAHRNGLMMSAPELAAHLRQVCGPPEEWRETEDVGPARTAALSAAGGTEVYDYAAEGEGTEQVGADELAPDELGEVMARPGLLGGRRATTRLTSNLDLGRLQGMELTSLINSAELEERGHRPLADWGDDDDEPAPPPVATPLPGRREATEPETPLPPARFEPARAPRPSASLGAVSPPTTTAAPSAAGPRLAAGGRAPGAPSGPPGAPGAAGPVAHAIGPGLAPPGLVGGPLPHEPPYPPPFAGPSPDRRRWLLSGAIAIGLVLVAGLAAALIGMSGPDVTPPPSTTPAAIVDGGAPAAPDGGGAPADGP